MTPGWKTTEFWTTILSKALTLLALFGFVNVNDSKTLEEALGKCVAAVFLFLANAQIVTRYIQSRLTLKAGEIQNVKAESRTPILPLLLIAVAGAICAETPAAAQPFLPYRYQMEQRLKEQKWLIGKLMEMQQQAPAPFAPAPPIIVAPPGPIAEAPKQLLPIPGEPKQALPIYGEPKQQLPLPGLPKQELPPSGTPKQDLPLAPPKATPPSKQAGPQSYTRIKALYRPLED